MPDEKPIAVISKATTPRQRTVDGTLATIVDEVAHAVLEAPAVIVVGEVVRLREMNALALCGAPLPL